MSLRKEEDKHIVLDKSNFRLWKWALSNHLAKKKCAYILDYIDQASAQRDRTPGYTNWEQHQFEGKIILQNVLNQNDLIYVMDCPSVALMVQKLERRYSRGFTTFQLNQNFSDLKWSRTEKADQFISNLNSIKDQFILKNIQIDDARLVQKLVSEIPHFLNDLKNEIQRRLNRNEELHYENICEEVVLLYDQRVRDHQKALTATDNKPKYDHNKKTDYKKSNKYCKYHKTNSHSTEECKVLKSKNNQQKNQNNQPPNSNSSSTNSSTTTNNNSSSNKPNQQSNLQSKSDQQNNPNSTVPKRIPDIFHASMTLFVESKREIHFDTCATRFMTPNRSDFSNYIQIEDGPLVLTGNGLVKAEGVGMVAIKSFNGQEWIDLELTEVFHVPSLPYFLFSEPVCGAVGVDTRTNNTNGELRLVYHGDTLFTGNRTPMKNETFKMNIQIVQKPELAANVAILSKLAHWRTGHCPYSSFESNN